MSGLSHVDDQGRARMVDVSAKADTARTAVAAGALHTTREVVELVRADGLPKADVLATARLAGIAGAKKTSELIPLCHQLALSSVRIDFNFTGNAITIEATAKTKGPTGVEMEALTAVAVAGLTLHDMVKARDPGAILSDIRLLTKDGGKQGHWERGAAATAARPTEPWAAGRRAVVLVSSTRAAAGDRHDTTGPVIAQWLAAQGFIVGDPQVHADAHIAAAIRTAVAAGPEVIITTGGTGVSPTDNTPEATRAVLTQELPGIAESIRMRGMATFPAAALSRGLAGVARDTVIINLPGSAGGVRDGIDVLEPILAHLLDQVATGGGHD